MAKELSPKKYIETNARKLPIYKCFVNKDWETAKMANVFIMRKHTNGNITTGMYLVDLACLGIKDTFFEFNVSEKAIQNKMDQHEITLIPIDYNLAHNIVYAGHDFALEYDINPHSDFATTKFILEEDDDNIPMIEIAVGDEEGKPHLILQPGQMAKYKHVYQKLLKNPGAGNFYYTMGVDKFDNLDIIDKMEDPDDDFDDSDDDEEDEILIEDFFPGEISRLYAKDIDIEELVDTEKVNKRLPSEILTLQIELGIRVLYNNKKELFYTEEELDEKVEYVILSEADMYPDWISNDIMEEATNMIDNDAEALNEFGNENDSIEDLIAFDDELFDDDFQQYQHNPYVLHLLYEKSVVLNKQDKINLLKPFINKMAFQHVSAKLLLALCTYYLNETNASINYVIEGTDITKIFPTVKAFSQLELNLFAMLRLLANIRNGNIKEAIYYYNLLAEIDMISTMIPILQMQMEEFLTVPIKDSYNELNDIYNELKEENNELKDLYNKLKDESED